MIYVYAIAEGIGTIADLSGVQDEPLSLLPFEPAQLVIGDVASRPPIDARALRTQDTLVRLLHERASALLPMRFATIAADRDDLRRLLDQRSDLLARLSAVRGCEQMLVRVFGSLPPPPEGTTAPLSGTEYLRARAHRLQPPDVLRQLADAPGDLARESRIEAASQPGVLGAVYHLIRRGHAEQYRDVMETSLRRHQELRTWIRGPSPAYAFA